VEFCQITYEAYSEYIVCDSRSSPCSSAAVDRCDETLCTATKRDRYNKYDGVFILIVSFQSIGTKWNTLHMGRRQITLPGIVCCSVVVAAYLEQR